MIPLAFALQVAAALTMPCVGTERSAPVGAALPETGGTPFEIVYRVDLDAGSWCTDDCATPEPIASIEDGIIVLHDEYSGTGSHIIALNPANGRFADTLIEGGTTTLRTGVCRRTGFESVPDRAA